MKEESLGDSAKVEARRAARASPYVWSHGGLMREMALINLLKSNFEKVF